jgi:hypothetical protein
MALWYKFHMNPWLIFLLMTKPIHYFRESRKHSLSEVDLGTRDLAIAEMVYEKASHPVRYAWSNTIGPILFSLCLIVAVVGGIIGVGALGIYLLSH